MLMKGNILLIIQELIILYLLLTGFISHKLFAQDFIPNNFVSYYHNPQNLGFSTPQTSELAKYTQANVDYYNGLLNFELPILSYQDASFDIPITIRYISDGFKPGRRPSIIGNNWMLNVGGVITRNVVGSPDDVKGYKESTVTGKYMLDGLLVAIRSGTYKYYTKNDLYNLNLSMTNSGNPYVSGDLEHDYAPDIFNFSFGGHKGYFYIGNDGAIKSSLGEGYLIDISNMPIQNYSTTESPSNSIIKITTPDGYIYEFGGDTSYMEYNIPNNPSGIKTSPVQIISWYLKSIYNANNKRLVLFKYKQYEQKNKYKVFALNAYNKYMYPQVPTTGPVIPSSNISAKCIVVEDRLYVPIINEIIIGDVHINFKIGNMGKSFYNETINDLLYLDEIKESCGNINKTIKFDYLQKENYFFLHKLELNAQGTTPDVYSFDYNLNMTLPDTQTIALDHWGYWNGGYAIDEDAKTYLNYIDNRKAVNTNVTDVTMLTKIKHPTKGETKVTYESNRYNYWSSRNEDNKISWNINYSDTSIPCGGVRVKKIVDCDFSGKINTVRTYYYTTLSDKGSGIIGVLPQYKLPVENLSYMAPPQFVNGTWKYYSVKEEVWSISSNTIGRFNNIPEYHIGYSDVIEKYDNNSKICYHFTSMLDIPNDENTNAKIHEQSSVNRSFNKYKLLSKFGLYILNDLSEYRGKLISKITYSTKQEMMSMHYYYYNINELISSYDISILSSSIGLVANRIFNTPCHIVKEFHTDINGVEINKMYSYNTKNLISEKQIVQSNDDTLKLSYIYPFEKSNLIEGTNYLSNLVEINKINEPILTVKSIQQNNKNNKVLAAIKNNFDIFNNQILKCSLSEWDSSNHNASKSLIQNENFKIREQYLKYDDYGNIVYLINSNRDKIVYIWSYRGKYPIAEIKGTTYEQVSLALGLLPESLSNETEPDIDKINTLRVKLPDAFINTYTYLPLIGLITITNPQGITTYFEYDSSRRLSGSYMMKNGKREYTEEYIYHYK